MDTRTLMIVMTIIIIVIFAGVLIGAMVWLIRGIRRNKSIKTQSYTGKVTLELEDRMVVGVRIVDAFGEFDVGVRDGVQISAATAEAFAAETKSAAVESESEAFSDMAVIRDERTAEIVREVEEAKEENSDIILLKVVKWNYREIYEGYDEKMREYVDGMIRYALSKPETNLIDSEKYATVYYRKKMVLRLVLKRDQIVANVLIGNSKVRSVAQAAALGIREKPTVIKVVNAEGMKIVNEIVDISYENLLEDRRLREEQKKQLRRDRRAQKKFEDKIV